MIEKEKPHIICHMMSTIDGKITGGDGVDIMSDEFFGLYTETEDKLPSHTAWMCGRVTMQMFASSETQPLPTASQVDTSDFIAQHEGNMYMFGVDTKGQLRWDKNSIKLSNITDPLHLVIVVTEATPKEYLQYLQDKGISYLVAGNESIDFPKLFASIKEKMTVETLLLEGGGLLNGSVMAADMVDEISLLMTPKVANRGNAPSLFERKVEEPLNVTDYTLIDVKQMAKGSVWLRYKKSGQIPIKNKLVEA
jgi:2,5-diamino-6-(ribosylamino)-4(3H)-pyrimidinone 5'-phosphate reductase